MAANVISRLSILVSASANGVRTGMTQAGGYVSRFTKRLGAARSRIGGFVKGSLMSMGRGALWAGKQLMSAGRMVALFTIGAGVAIGVMVGRQYSAIDATAKLSDRLGVAIETLQEYQHAATLAGVENTELERGMVKMQKTVSEAAIGLGTAKDSLRDIGLDPKALNALPIDQQFETISAALSKVTNQNDKARIAMEVFGRNGSKFLKLLDNDGLKNAAADVNRFGLALSRVDAAKVEGANDAMARVKLLFTQVLQKLGAEVAPIVTALSEMFLEAADNSGDIGDAIESTGEVIRDAIESTGEVIRGVIGVSIDIFQGFMGVITNAGLTIKHMGIDALQTVDELQKAFGVELFDLDSDELFAAELANLQAMHHQTERVKKAWSGGFSQEFTDRVMAAERAAQRAVNNLDAAVEGAAEVQELTKAPVKQGVAAVEVNTMAGFEAILNGRDQNRSLEQIAEKQLAQNQRAADGIWEILNHLPSPGEQQRIRIARVGP